MNISLVTVCRNEFERLEDWYDYHSKMFDDIVVVDQNSTDETPSLQKKFNIINHDKVGWSELSREFACSLAKNDWILYLDIDENIVIPHLSFLDLIDMSMCGYNIVRENYIDNTLGETDKQYRLFNKNKSIFYTEIHTQIKPCNSKQRLEMPQNLMYIKHCKSTEEYKLDNDRYKSFGFKAL